MFKNVHPSGIFHGQREAIGWIAAAHIPANVPAYWRGRPRGLVRPVDNLLRGRPAA